jgi:hypothetical protein
VVVAVWRRILQVLKSITGGRDVSRSFCFYRVGWGVPCPAWSSLTCRVRSNREASSAVIGVSMARHLFRARTIMNQHTPGRCPHTSNDTPTDPPASPSSSSGYDDPPEGEGYYRGPDGHWWRSRRLERSDLVRMFDRLVPCLFCAVEAAEVLLNESPSVASSLTSAALHAGVMDVYRVLQDAGLMTVGVSGADE